MACTLKPTLLKLIFKNNTYIYLNKYRKFVGNKIYNIQETFTKTIPIIRYNFTAKDKVLETTNHWRSRGGGHWA